MKKQIEEGPYLVGGSFYLMRAQEESKATARRGEPWDFNLRSTIDVTS